MILKQLKHYSIFLNTYIIRTPVSEIAESVILSSVLIN